MRKSFSTIVIFLALLASAAAKEHREMSIIIARSMEMIFRVFMGGSSLFIFSA